MKNIENHKLVYSRLTKESKSAHIEHYGDEWYSAPDMFLHAVEHYGGTYACCDALTHEYLSYVDITLTTSDTGGCFLFDFRTHEEYDLTSAIYAACNGGIVEICKVVDGHMVCIGYID